jgi:hypothetical protein
VSQIRLGFRKCFPKCGFTHAWKIKSRSLFLLATYYKKKGLRFEGYLHLFINDVKSNFKISYFQLFKHNLSKKLQNKLGSRKVLKTLLNESTIKILKTQEKM